MDTNFIRKDGFSNPDTERLFREKWDEERMDAVCAINRHCGMCLACEFLVESPEENLWLLCRDEDSPYFLETLHFPFSCEHHDRSAKSFDIARPW